MPFASNDARNGKGRKALELRGLDQIQRKIVGHEAHRHADQNILNQEGENDERREDSTRRGNRKRLEDVLEDQLRTRPGDLQTAREGSRLRRLNANSHREVDRRTHRLNVRQADREPPKLLELLAATGAGLQM